MVAEVPTVLVTTQWALLLGLAVLVVVMYRQLAYLLNIGRALSGAGGLELGERAPGFEYLTRVPGATEGWERRAFAVSGAPTLLMFTHPGCGSCDVALQNLQRVLEKSHTTVRALAITDATLEAIDAADIRPHRPLEIAKVDKRTTTKLYRTYRTPFVYGLSSSGEVRARGGGATPREIRKMLRQVSETE